MAVNALTIPKATSALLSYSSQGNLPQARFVANISEFMKLMGRVTSNETGLSPKEWEHLWKGYLRTFGTYVLGAVNVGSCYCL